MNKRIPLIILVGPTGIGKTDLSIKLAKFLNCEIISADSMQNYKFMNIGTAKIKDEEKDDIKHYLIDEIYPDEEYNVSKFQQNSEEYIKHIYNNNKIPMIVGGTGLYINSIVYDLDFSNTISNPEFREELNEEAKKYGNEYIFEKLKKVDIVSSERIHKNDTKRIIRALEIYNETGKPMSDFYINFRKHSSKYDIAFIGLTRDRSKLYDRINKRVDIMMQEGLVNEVKDILDMGYNKNLTSLQGLGYKEVIDYLDGKYGLEDAVETLKRDTRRFAKRQLTWFRRDDRIRWFNFEDYESKDVMRNDIIQYVQKVLNLL